MKKIIITALTIFSLAFSSEAKAQDAMLGEIKLFAGNFAPRGWALCEGQLLAVKDNMSLFSIIGTMYGGDGRTTFALPDLRGRAPIGVGSGPGLDPVKQGEKNRARGGDKTNGQPTLGLRYIICTKGVFPSRN